MKAYQVLLRSVSRVNASCVRSRASGAIPETGHLRKRDGIKQESDVGTITDVHFGHERGDYICCARGAETKIPVEPHAASKMGILFAPTARSAGTLTIAWWQTRPIHLLGVTGFDRVGLRWAAGRGRLATLNRGTVKLN